jgi:hypothetical protein
MSAAGLKKCCVSPSQTILHRLNPLHVYCRLRVLLPKSTARYLCTKYEQRLFPKIREIVRKRYAEEIAQQNKGT